MLNSYLTILGVDRNFSILKLMSSSIAFVVMLSHSFSSVALTNHKDSVLFP